MRRVLGLIAVVALSGILSGCAACSAPYDYCAPTFVDPGCDDCMVHGRLGSILDPGGNYYDGGYGDDYSTYGPELAPEEPTWEEDRGEPYYEPPQRELVPPELEDRRDSQPDVLPEPDTASRLRKRRPAPMGRRPRPLYLQR